MITQPPQHAPAVVSRTTGADTGHLGAERGHRPLVIPRKGGPYRDSAGPAAAGVSCGRTLPACCNDSVMRGRPVVRPPTVPDLCYRWIVQLKLADPDAPVVSVAVTVTE